MSKPKYLVDESQKQKGWSGFHYIRAWRDRQGINVQIWLKKKSPIGEPDGDWAMPKVLGLSTAIAQAVLQTEERP